MWHNIGANQVLDTDMNDDYKTSEGLKSIYKKYVKGALQGGIAYHRLEKTLKKVIKVKKFYASPIQFGLITVNLSKLEPLSLTKDTIPKNQLIDYLLASAACFPAFETKKIGHSIYVDGGYYDNLPISLAVSMGADEVIAVDLEEIGRKQKCHFEHVKITCIRPNNKLGSFLVFHKDLARRNMKFGYNDTMKLFGKLEGKKYTFRLKELVKNNRKYFPTFENHLREILTINKKNKLDEILKMSAFHKIVKSSSTVQKSYFNELVEELGEDFQVDETEIYTCKAYHHALIELFTTVVAPKEVKIPKSGRKMDYKKLFHKKELIAYLYYKIADKKEWKNMGIVMLTFPHEFLKALYLHVIIHHK